MVLSRHTRLLSPLSLGQHVLIQDQDKASKTYKQWTKTGIVINAGAYDDYQVRIDGSRNITKQNRQFLKPVHLKSDALTLPKLGSSGFNYTSSSTYGDMASRLGQSPSVPDVMDQCNSTSDKAPESGTRDVTSHALSPSVPKITLRRQNEEDWVVAPNGASF